MAKNVSREFATMDEDERRRFALEQTEGDPDEVKPLDFPEDDPRSPDRMGRKHSRRRE